MTNYQIAIFIDIRGIMMYAKIQTLLTTQRQLPFDLNADIPMDHLVRGVNFVVEEIDLSKLCDRYSEAGCPAYHPQWGLLSIAHNITKLARKMFGSAPAF